MQLRLILYFFTKSKVQSSFGKIVILTVATSTTTDIRAVISNRNVVLEHILLK
jgi:hypothetical protein